MNTIIKFRAWDKTKNKMVKVGELRWKERGTFIGGGDTWFADNLMVLAETWSKDVMQFTGLKDKNGKDIYEGDILQFKSQSLLDSWAGKKMATMVARIYWNQEELAFYIINKKAEFKPNMRTDNNQFEIIGNIYENPNLIK